MNKHLLRLVALLLIPCLIADPSTVSAFTSTLAPSRERVGVRGDVAIQTRFEEEAFELQLTSYFRDPTMRLATVGGMYHPLESYLGSIHFFSRKHSDGLTRRERSRVQSRGVSTPNPPSPDPGRRKILKWLGIGAGVAAVGGIGYFWETSHSSTLTSVPPLLNLPLPDDAAVRAALRKTLADQHYFHDEIERIALLPGWTRADLHDAVQRLDKLIAEGNIIYSEDVVFGVVPNRNSFQVHKAHLAEMLSLGGSLLFHEATHLASRDEALRQTGIDAFNRFTNPPAQAGLKDEMQYLQNGIVYVRTHWLLERSAYYYQTALEAARAEAAGLKVEDYTLDRLPIPARRRGLNPLEYLRALHSGQRKLSASDHFLQDEAQMAKVFKPGHISDDFNDFVLGRLLGDQKIFQIIGLWARVEFDPDFLKSGFSRRDTDPEYRTRFYVWARKTFLLPEDNLALLTPPLSGNPMVWGLSLPTNIPAAPNLNESKGVGTGAAGEKAAPAAPKPPAQNQSTIAVGLSLLFLSGTIKPLAAATLGITVTTSLVLTLFVAGLAAAVYGFLHNRSYLQKSASDTALSVRKKRILRILVVDDDPIERAQRMGEARRLTSLFDVGEPEFLEASEGLEGYNTYRLYQIGTKPIDLIITDVFMGGSQGDGYKFATKVREFEEWRADIPRVPIAVVGMGGHAIGLLDKGGQIVEDFKDQTHGFKFLPQQLLIRIGEILDLPAVVSPGERDTKNATPLALYFLVPDEVKRDPEALDDYILNDAPDRETNYGTNIFVTLAVTPLLFIPAFQEIFGRHLDINWLYAVTFPTVFFYVTWNVVFGFLHRMAYRWNADAQQWELDSKVTASTKVGLAWAATYVHWPILAGTYLNLTLCVYCMFVDPDFFIRGFVMICMIHYLSTLYAPRLHQTYSLRQKKTGGAALTLSGKEPFNPASDPAFLKKFGRMVERLCLNRGWTRHKLYTETGFLRKKIDGIMAGTYWLQEKFGIRLSETLDYDATPFYKGYTILSWKQPGPDGQPAYAPSISAAIIYYMTLHRIEEDQVLSDKTGVNIADLTQYLAGSRLPSLDVMRRIATALPGMHVAVVDPVAYLDRLMAQLQMQSQAPDTSTAQPTSASPVKAILREDGTLSFPKGIATRLESESKSGLMISFKLQKETAFHAVFPNPVDYKGETYHFQRAQKCTASAGLLKKFETLSRDTERVPPGDYWVQYHISKLNTDSEYARAYVNRDSTFLRGLFVLSPKALGFNLGMFHMPHVSFLNTVLILTAAVLAFKSTHWIMHRTPRVQRLKPELLQLLVAA